MYYKRMSPDQNLFDVPAKPRLPDDLLTLLESADFLSYLSRRIYGDRDPAWLEEQRQRYVDTVKLHKRRFGDRPLCLLRAPGRLNLFLEYLDICRGDHMSTTIDGDIPMAVSAAGETPDRVSVHNQNPLFAYSEFSISEERARFLDAPWTEHAAQGIPDTWQHRSQLNPCFGRRRGDSMNYILAPYLHMSYTHPHLELKGCDITIGASTIPIRAGTSSSSAMVVLSTMAMWMMNRDVLPKMNIREVCRFLGEAEWYVGTRGGANDQTSILRNELDGIIYNLHHLELIDSVVLPWLRGVEVIVCNSLWEADKALGARYIFNMRKGWTDLASDLLEKLLRLVDERLSQGRTMDADALAEVVELLFPQHRPEAIAQLASHPGCWVNLIERFNHLGSLDKGLLGLELPVIEAFIHLLPETITPDQAQHALAKTRDDLERDYTLPRGDDIAYEPRQAARFFFNENVIGRELEALLIEADRRLRDEDGFHESAEYDRYRQKIAEFMNRVQQDLKHVFQVSHPQLELLIEMAEKGPGYMAGKLTGAGSGGCVCLLVRQGQAEKMLAWLDEHYFGKSENFAHYRKTLGELAASSDPRDQDKAGEMEENLDQALAQPAMQRKVIRFSQGACAIDPELP